MRTDHWYDSCGKGQIHYCRWTPEGEIKGIMQIIHGIAEFVERYDDFANYLNAQGYLVVAEDHMGHGQSIEGGSTQGFFHGGWFAAVNDSLKLMKDTMAPQEIWEDRKFENITQGWWVLPQFSKR